MAKLNQNIFELDSRRLGCQHIFPQFAIYLGHRFLSALIISIPKTLIDSCNRLKTDPSFHGHKNILIFNSDHTAFHLYLLRVHGQFILICND
jgi:hypothetical protein